MDGLEHAYILVVNSGSSSLKLTLFHGDLRLKDIHIKGLQPQEASRKLPKLLEEMSNISLIGIGHRFVHGGSRYRASALIDQEVLENLKRLVDLAPLHNAACLEGIEVCLDFFQDTVLQVAVFDTAFHQTLPEVAASYAIPNDLAEKYTLRRYGFHGISHAFLVETYKQSVGPAAKLITLHLGNGCSMAAIRNGQSVDTSMGFTPAEGLVMATRAGDIDAGIIEFLARHEDKSAGEVVDLLNTQSGLLGVSSLSADMESLLSADLSKAQIRLAIDLFCYRILKYLGAYAAVLGGVEALIFAGGIGENAPQIRRQIIQGMAWAGIELDEAANQKSIGLSSGEIRLISALHSTVAVYVVATDENQSIAKEVRHQYVSFGGCLG